MKPSTTAISNQTTMNDTKQRVLATVRTAINTPAPRLISFKHLSTVQDEPFVDQAIGYVRYAFEVNGVQFQTGWSDPEHYSFLAYANLYPETSALTIQDLKLLLWWLEEGDTKVVEQVREPYQYLA
jgi:hypothetical protein